MHNSYDDIRNRIAQPPVWFDENGVPRYDIFKPQDGPNIYADEACLLLIRCQSCGHEFQVGLQDNRMAGGPTLAELIRNRLIHYGDPPYIGCCGAGPTMSSVPMHVLEYWHRSDIECTEEIPGDPNGLRRITDIARYMEWRRDPALEIDVIPAWADSKE